MNGLNVENTVSTIVESMLPRFSDRQLALHVTLQFNVSDFGYGKDGNTRERKELRVAEYINFLFLRPSNYTKVFSWIPDSKASGLELSPRYKTKIWTFECDHDSCWRDSIGTITNRVWSNIIDKFKGRKIGGSEMNPYRDTSQFNYLESDCQYVKLETFEKVNPKAERFSEEGKPYRIGFKSLNLYDLNMPKSLDVQKTGQCGLLIVGSPDYVMYKESYAKTFDNLMFLKLEV